MKNILFLTDFSESSMEAIHYVYNLFSAEEKNYFILNVSKAGSLSLSKLMTNDSIYDTVIRDNKEKLKVIKSTLEKQYNTNFKASIRFNSFVDAVKEYVAKHNIDLIVSGFDGANSIEEKIFGSNTLNLIRSLKTDTIIVPQEVTHTNPTSVLCLLDDQDDLSIVLKNDFLKGKKLSIIRVINNGNYSEASKDRFLLKNLQEIDYKVITNIPMEYVKSYEMQTKNIDLSVLLVEESSALERLFTDNSTTKISKSLLKPILILHQ
ncbi:universal stress protein [Tenacibaculum sp. MEBiC06402]|uniref:universal stress protein n=1 Tax=unclassified Tenacibaculum TaxID=2635139 RepID=UPI003B9D109B